MMVRFLVFCFTVWLLAWIYCLVSVLYDREEATVISPLKTLAESLPVEMPPMKKQRPKAILALVRGEFPSPQDLVNIYNKYTTTDRPRNRHASDIGVSFPAKTALNWVNQLQGIESPGGKQTSYFSIADIQSNVAIDKQLGVEWIFYDLEGGLSPDSEVVDPISSINTAASIVHSQGLKFAFTVVNVGRHPRDIVPHVIQNAEGYNPQGQSFFAQGCDVYAQAVGDVIILAKQTNPRVAVWAQLSLIRGNVETNKQCFNRLNEYVSQRGYTVDGVTVFYRNDSSDLPSLDEFYSWFTENYR